jgi:crotonobetainyl-CoA:carnitine CoA-transferase CaiB-like acyl-CoA transferase
MLLKGVRVIDFGRFIAGPYCAALLADYGADVIRVERIEGGEDRCVPALAPTGEGGLYMQMNRNKRCLTADLGSAEAKKIVQRLVSSADVVVANLPPATLKAWSLDYETLKRINPRIVLTLATAYGTGGPYSNRPGFDTIGQAMSGAMHMSGEPDRPARTVANYNDIGTATACAMGTLAALWERERSGEGQLVEGSLLRTSLIHTNALLIEQALTGRNRQPQGNRSFVAAPIDAFKTKTGWISVQSIGQPMFERLCKVVGRPELATDPRFGNDELRGQHSEEISAIMSAWSAPLERDEVLHILSAAKIPASPVYDLQQTLDDPHIQAMNFFQPGSFPGIHRPIPIASHPVEFSRTGLRTNGRAPMLGEHTTEVLAEIGYSDAEIETFIRLGVVGGIRHP